MGGLEDANLVQALLDEMTGENLDRDHGDYGAPRGLHGDDLPRPSLAARSPELRHSLDETSVGGGVMRLRQLTHARWAGAYVFLGPPNEEDDAGHDRDESDDEDGKAPLQVLPKPIQHNLFLLAGIACSKVRY